LAPDCWFWDFAASLLITLVVQQDQSFAIPDLVGRPLCEAMIDVLRARNQNATDI
jgi:beta-lactam-binding protein with PASTA domain